MSVQMSQPWCQIVDRRNCSPLARRTASAGAADDWARCSLPTCPPLPTPYQTSTVTTCPTTSPYRNRPAWPMPPPGYWRPRSLRPAQPRGPTCNRCTWRSPCLVPFDSDRPLQRSRLTPSQGSTLSVLAYSTEPLQMRGARGRHKGSSNAAQSAGIESGRSNRVDGSAVRMATRSQPRPRLCDQVLESPHRAFPTDVLGG